MKLFSAKSVLSVFYYLIAIDGEISKDELEKFDEIGKEIDLDNYFSYKESLIEECSNKIRGIKDIDDYYDILIENVDRALYDNSAEDKNIPSRLLIWNMLVIAFSNGEYAGIERKLIRHTVRVVNVEENVFLQMEQLVKTSVSVEKELEWIKQTDRSYSEVVPVVAELEKRLTNISIFARQLIDDEINQPQIGAIEIKSDVFDEVREKTGKLISGTKNKIDEVATPVVKDIKDKTGKLLIDSKEKLGEVAAPVIKDVKDQTLKLFGNLKSKIKSKSENNTEDKNKSKETKGEN